ncbi:amino acid/amide ABC transporter membrane protein 2 (HAAT family) [Hypnocyclicus thermotrophus]|uniref:Amino acid/amide ABC transporter membrane protein 2 (HAAT family) n=1 Tax=Hypnocyclicus thermotrophus TaxID=1627895 RepID=A0AA46I4R1_9FUSO|nr:branched-chain amino acid ABC transporter permease [Hypnocyclicus thermotrophus]TDT66973.1 amino acid/amide ABC transporter membrane protein 2 (HAAT family) [Hypnocyclicus thermotrophus]
MEQYILLIMTLITINIILAVSLNVINGLMGYLSLGHAGFMAIGAYTSAILTTQYNFPIFISVIIGAILAGFFGFLIGFPTLRLKGDYLAIVTLGFGEIIRIIILNMTITGGAKGYPGIPGIKGLNGFLIGLGFAIVTVIVITNIALSAEGRALLSIRENEIAAESMGVNITRYKIKAFIIGSLFAGLAGGLYAHLIQYVKPDNFNLYKTVDILLMVVLGGSGSITGSILAAIALTSISELLREFSEYRMLVYPLMLIILMLVRPNGILGKKEITDFISFKKKRGV